MCEGISRIAADQYGFDVCELIQMVLELIDGPVMIGMGVRGVVVL